jgi:APA family basic amino acid/polyamine antiporter
MRKPPVTTKEVAAVVPTFASREAGGEAKEVTNRGPGLIRVLGLWTSMSVVVGVMVGSGIFLKPAEIAAGTGSVAWAMAAWAAAAALSFLSVLCYLEIGTSMPQAASDYAFLRRAFGPGVSFIYGWRSVVVSGPASHASQAAGVMLFSEYYWPELANPLFTLSSPTLPWIGSIALTMSGLRLGAGLLIVGFTVLALAGIRAAGRTLLALTVVKVLFLVAIVATPFILGRGSTGSFRNIFGPENWVGEGVTFAGFTMAVYAALWAFSGSRGLLRVAGEIKDPSRTLPRATVWGFIVTTLLYLLITAVCFYVLGLADVVGSPHVVSDMLERVGGPALAGLLTVVMIVSSFGSLSGTAVRAGRLPLAMAQDGLFPPSMAKVHEKTRAPVWAIVIPAVASLALALTGSFTQLTGLVVFVSWSFVALQILALFKLRVTEPHLPRPVRTLGYPVVPALTLLLTIILTVTVFLQHPGRSLFGIVVVSTGVPVYLAIRRRNGNGHRSPAGQGREGWTNASSHLTE